MWSKGLAVSPPLPHTHLSDPLAPHLDAQTVRRPWSVITSEAEDLGVLQTLHNIARANALLQIVPFGRHGCAVLLSLSGQKAAALDQLYTQFSLKLLLLLLLSIE